MFKSHIQLVATVLDSAGIEYFHSRSKFYWTALYGRRMGTLRMTCLEPHRELQTELGWDPYFSLPKPLVPDPGIYLPLPGPRTRMIVCLGW